MLNLQVPTTLILADTPQMSSKQHWPMIAPEPEYEALPSAVVPDWRSWLATTVFNDQEYPKEQQNELCPVGTPANLGTPLFKQETHQNDTSK